MPLDEHTFEFLEQLIFMLTKMYQGFTRIFDILPDISLDVPNAADIMDKILNECHAKGFVNDGILNLASNKYELVIAIAYFSKVNI